VIAGIPKLQQLDLRGRSGLSYSHRRLPSDWVAPEFNLSETGLSAVAVDQLLIDLAETDVHDGQLQITGNNAGHSVASDAAITALRLAGWLVGVNGDGA
jgi:hypothetical protein